MAKNMELRPIAQNISFLVAGGRNSILTWENLRKREYKGPQKCVL